MTCPHSLSNQEETGSGLRSVSIPSALVCSAGFSSFTILRPERTRDLLGAPQQLGASQTALQRAIPFWLLCTGLDNSPVLELRWELTDAVIVLKSVPELGPWSQASQQISASLDSPLSPRFHPVTTPSPPPAFCMLSLVFNPLNLLPKKTLQSPQTSHPGRRPAWNVGGGSPSCL